MKRLLDWFRVFFSSPIDLPRRQITSKGTTLMVACGVAWGPTVDIGFRPEGWNGKARTGTWLVRIDGQWVEAQSAIETVAATR